VFIYKFVSSVSALLFDGRMCEPNAATKCPIDSDDNLRTFASNMYEKSFAENKRTSGGWCWRWLAGWRRV